MAPQFSVATHQPRAPGSRSRQTGIYGHDKPERPVTIDRNHRSRSTRIAGHDKPERSVTVDRNTHLAQVDPGAKGFLKQIQQRESRLMTALFDETSDGGLGLLDAALANSHVVKGKVT